MIQEADEIIVLAEDDDAVTRQSEALFDFDSWRRSAGEASFEEADPNDNAPWPVGLVVAYRWYIVIVGYNRILIKLVYIIHFYRLAGR